MKTRKLLGTIILLLFGVSMQSQIQNNSIVIKSNQFEFIIDNNIDYKKEIILDISELKFKSDEIRKRYFDSISDNILTYRYIGNSKVSLILQNNLVNNSKKITDWNNYIKSCYQKYDSMFKQINK